MPAPQESKRPKTSISLPDGLKERARPRYTALGYKSFSEYVEALILTDIQTRFAHVVVRDEGATKYATRPKALHEESECDP